MFDYNTFQVVQPNQSTATQATATEAPVASHSLPITKPKKTILYKPLLPYPAPGPVRISTISAVAFLASGQSPATEDATASSLSPSSPSSIVAIRKGVLSDTQTLRVMQVDFDTFYARLPLVDKDSDALGVFTMKHYAKHEDKTITQSIRIREHGEETETKTPVKKYFQNQLTIIWKYRTSKGDVKTTNGFMFTNGKVKGVGLKCNDDIPLSFEALRNHLEQHQGVLGDAFRFNAVPMVANEGRTADVSEEIRAVMKRRRSEGFKMGELDALPAVPTSSPSPSPASPASPSPTTSSASPASPHPPLWLYGTRATMYNTDFSAHFQIVREELFHIILDHCHLDESEFEPDIYPAVKIKFAWNHDYLHGTQSDNCIPGVCYCTQKCSGKGCGKGNGQCKVVTVCVFGNDAPKRHDAKIIITGANSYQQVEEVYRYMNGVLREHYEEVFYREPYMGEVPVCKDAEE